MSFDLVVDLFANDQTSVSLEVVEDNCCSNQNDDENETESREMSFFANSSTIVPVDILSQIGVANIRLGSKNVADSADDHFGLEIFFDKIIVDEHRRDQIYIIVFLAVNIRLEHTIGRVIGLAFIAKAGLHTTNDFVVSAFW